MVKEVTSGDFDRSFCPLLIFYLEVVKEASSGGGAKQLVLNYHMGALGQVVYYFIIILPHGTNPVTRVSDMGGALMILWVIGQNKLPPPSR